MYEGGWCGAPPHAPAGDEVPCTPLLGRSPKESSVWRVVLALALSSHLGLRPKPHASRLSRSLLLLEMKLREKGRFPRYLIVFFNRLKGRGTYATALSFTIHFYLVRTQAPRVGFWGVAPNGNARPKQNGVIKLIIPLGRSPNKGVQGDGGERVPCGHLREAQSEPEESTETSGGHGSALRDD